MRLTSWNLLHGLPTPLTTAPISEAVGHFAAVPTPQEALKSAVLTLNPDVLGVQEVDYHLIRSGSQNQVGVLAEMLGAADWAFAPSLIGSPDENWRGTEASDARILTNMSDLGLPGYGIGLISKTPVISWHRLELSAAPMGIPMTLPRDGKLKRIYVQDHPRSALAAELENGWLIINTHLSFVPIFNYLQLLKIKRWTKVLPITDKSKIIIMGDLNLPISLPLRGLNWNSLVKARTYPSWNPKLQLDYFLSQKISPEDVVQVSSAQTGISDHLPLTVELD